MWESPKRLYRLMGEELEIVSSAKDLGVTVSMDLKWTAHIAHVVAKSNRMLGFRKRNCLRDLNNESLKLLYIFLVRSNLCYCLTALGAAVFYIDTGSRKYPKDSCTFYLQELRTIMQGHTLDP